MTTNPPSLSDLRTHPTRLPTSVVSPCPYGREEIQLRRSTTEFVLKVGDEKDPGPLRGGTVTSV